MKKLLTFAALGLVCASGMAQDAKKEEGFVFTTVKENPVTSVKNQSRAGTCWCYSSLAFIESELLRMGKGEYDLSEMFIVHNTYLDRADKAVRTHGDVSFSQGGSFYDALYGMEKFGLVPEAEMRPGVMYGDTLSNHTELTAVSNAVVDAIAKGRLRSLQKDANNQLLWKKAIESIHDIYLGERPEKFTYNGKEYTPKSFYESLGLNPDDYVSLTSYTHHPFYSSFVLEIQDNWRWAESYNLPIDEFMQVFDNAIMNGYTIAWGSDVSEKGFNARTGVASVPSNGKANDKTGSDAARWTGDNFKGATISGGDDEMTITQEMFRISGSNESECDGIASIPRKIEGVKGGVTIREQKNGKYKVSLRTVEPYDAAKICSNFGGGGHNAAAGCEFDCSLDEVKIQLLSKIADCIEYKS